MTEKPSYAMLEARIAQLEQQARDYGVAERNLAEEVRRFKAVYELSVAMTGDHDLDRNLGLVVEKCRELADSDMSFIALKDPAADEMYFRKTVGVRTQAFRNLRFPVAGSVGGQVFRDRKSRIIHNYADETGLKPPVLDVVLCEGLVSGIAVPVQMGGKILGTLYAFNRTATVFTSELVETLTLIGNMAAVEIHRQQIRRDLEEFHTELENRVARRTARLEKEIQDREVAEAALRQSEERFREMAAHIREVFWLFDWVNQRVVYVSPAYEEIWGRSTDQLYNRYEEWRESVHPEDRASAEASFQRILETGSGEVREYRIVRPDGSIRWISDRGFAIRDEAARVIRVTGIAEDITERRMAENEARKRQNFVEAVLSQAPDAIVTLDARHRVLDWNPGAVKMFGYTPEEAAGRNLDDLVAQFDRHAEAASVTQRVLAGDRIESFETVRHRKDGTPVHVIASGSPVVIGESLAGVVAVYTDITALKQVEAALRESEEQMRAIFHTIPDPVTVVRLTDGICVDVNEGFTRVSGYARKEIIGRTALDVGVWEDTGKRNELYRLLVEKGEAWNLEARFRTKSGDLIDGLISARVLTLGDTPHFIAITRDIGALKTAQEEKHQLEAQLRQAQKMEAIGTLAGGVAHDFNNLLMGIQGRNSLMMADLEPDDPLYEHLQGIEAYVRRASDLTKQLLGFARGGKYEIKPLNLNEVVAGSLALFGRTRKELRIHTHYRKGLRTVDADRRQIEQVLLNLFVNAWQAMPGGGNLYVDTDNVAPDRSQVAAHDLDQEHFVKISVTDTGVGMAADVRERIFDPFFTTKSMGRGTGLGLASAYGIVKNHGGFIDVNSEAGKGSTFTVYLPATEKTPVVETQPKASVVRGSETVMLVDDEEMILQVGKMMLTRLGYRVITANGGEAAIERYGSRGEEIGLVVLDMVMPSLGGAETFERLKAMDPDVRVLLSSGYSLDRRASQLLEKGCRGFIQKPFDIQQLSLRIREALAP